MVDIRARLELIRVPAVFSAHADIVAGFIIAGGAAAHLGRLIALMAATTLLYSAGMALNDVFDVAIDREERPRRPIPSGRVGLAEAFVIGMGGLITGAYFASLAGWVSAVVALLLVVAIIAYNGGLKCRPVAGPAAMGACRYLNLALGLSVVPHLPTMLLLPAITGVFIFGVTVLSRHEVYGGNVSPAVQAAILAVAASCFLGIVFFLGGIMPKITGVVLSILWAAGMMTVLFRLMGDASPERIQKTIRLLLMNLVVLDGILVTGFASPIHAAAVWLLVLPGRFLSRRFYVT